MEIEADRRPNCLILRISGDLRMWDNLDREKGFWKTLQDNVDSAEGQIILNLSRISDIDSRAIGSLVQIPVDCRRRDLKLSVVLPPGLPGLAIQRTHIFTNCGFFEDEDAAVSAVAAAPA